MKKLRAAIAITLLTGLSACGGVPSENGSNDPMEPLNRNIYAFNEVVDTVILEPVAQVYRFIMPEKGRIAVRNFLRNLGEPVNMANAALQGDVDRVFTSFWRFTLNSTLGVAGLYDFAGENSPLEYRSEDFGQTLAVWAGHDHSAYFVIPVLGPSTVRDTVGKVVDVFLNPWNYALKTEESIGIAVAGGITQREQMIDLMDDIDETSFDPYATYRSMYLQNRAKQIQNRQPTHQELVN